LAPTATTLAQNDGHYAIQGYSRPPLSVPIESQYATSYILTCNVSRTVSKISLTTDYWFNFAVERGCLSSTHSFWVDSNIQDCKIWPQEIRTIPLSYGV